MCSGSGRARPGWCCPGCGGGGGSPPPPTGARPATRSRGGDYVERIGGYEQLPGAVELAALPGPEALRRQVELVASSRALPFRDPGLPAALLPEGWPGRRAHELFTAAHDALHGPADAFVRDVALSH